MTKVIISISISNTLTCPAIINGDSYKVPSYSHKKSKLCKRGETLWYYHCKEEANVPSVISTAIIKSFKEQDLKK